VEVEVVEQVLGLYRERYFDFNVRHFHEKLRDEHEIWLSYSWVKGCGPQDYFLDFRRGRHAEAVPLGVYLCPEKWSCAR